MRFLEQNVARCHDVRLSVCLGLVCIVIIQCNLSLI